MRVLLDGAAFQNAHQRGIQRYFTEFLARLPAEAEVRMALAGGARAPLPARARPVRVDLGVASLLPRKARAPVGRLLAGPMTRRLARSSDLYHASYYTAPPSPRLPGVLTVYDMIAERFPDYFASRSADEEVSRKRRAILAASHIITISQHAASELLAFYPDLAGRVVAIPLGHEHVRRAPSTAGPAAPGIDGSYALFVGDRAGYKNFRVVLEGAAHQDWTAALRLAVVGPPWRENERALVARLSLETRVAHLGRVDDARLAALYAGASCVIVPSLAEGFGLPIIEAQAATAPVVCSDIPVFREVAGEAALFFDPHHPDALAARIAEATDPPTAARLRQAGAANLPRFTWEQCALRTWEVYLKAAGRG